MEVETDTSSLKRTKLSNGDHGTYKNHKKSAIPGLVLPVNPPTVYKCMAQSQGIGERQVIGIHPKRED